MSSLQAMMLQASYGSSRIAVWFQAGMPSTWSAGSTTTTQARYCRCIHTTLHEHSRVGSKSTVLQLIATKVCLWTAFCQQNNYNSKDTDSAFLKGWLIRCRSDFFLRKWTAFSHLCRGLWHFSSEKLHPTYQMLFLLLFLLLLYIFIHYYTYIIYILYVAATKTYIKEIVA